MCGYQDTVEVERQARSNQNFYPSAKPAVGVPLYGCQLRLHLLPTLFFPAKSTLIVPTLSTLIIPVSVNLLHYIPEEVLTCLHLQVKSIESSPLSQK